MRSFIETRLRPFDVSAADLTVWLLFLFASDDLLPSLVVSTPTIGFIKVSCLAFYAGTVNGLLLRPVDESTFVTLAGEMNLS